MAPAALRLLHAIHDFLPRHQAGSEIYTLDLCRTLLDRGHHVTVTCAAYEPSRPHGNVTWRLHEGVPVVEIANNWTCNGFEDTYRDPLVTSRITSVLHAVQPDVVHVHSLLNLSFDLPRLAHARGAAVVATLHDYTLVCPAGGQRIHAAAGHVCHDIDPSRCARCFGESPFGTQAAFGRIAGRQRLAAPLAIAARAVRAVVPRAAASVGTRLPGLPVNRSDIEHRLDAARRVFDDVDLFVAPSASIAHEYARLGVPESKLRVSDYGFEPWPVPRAPHTWRTPLRVGFVGTLVWHKGIHVLLDAVRQIPSASYELTICGDPNVFPDYAADLRSSASGLPVRFAGRFARRDVASVYDQIDLLVVPSLWLENSPLVIHEALMAGVPVIGSDIGGIPDLIQDDVNGLLFEAGNADALAAALRRCVEDRSLVSRLASAQTAIRTHDEDVCGWEQIYREVVARRTPVEAL